MLTRILFLVAIALAGLILFSRAAGEPTPVATPGVDLMQEEPVQRYTPGEVSRAPRLAPLPGTDDLGGPSLSPTLDRNATLAIRRRLAREGDRVYIDSIWPQTDSVVVRWAERSGLPITVAFLPDTSLEGWSASFVDAARSGMRAWAGNAANLEFREIEEPDQADIIVSWVETVSGNGEFGVTEITWDGSGHAMHANITLALRPEPDVRIVPPGPMRRVAVHEFGHAMGLPHSDSRDDIMFQTSPVASPSSRDQATLRLLYAVPPGSLLVR